jgi:hypothetical protein
MSSVMLETEAMQRSIDLLGFEVAPAVKATLRHEKVSGVTTLPSSGGEPTSSLRSSAIGSSTLRVWPRRSSGAKHSV